MGINYNYIWEEFKQFLLSLSNISSQNVFWDYKDICQWGSKSVDQLVNRINMLKEQMSLYPEATQAHTLLFALNLSMQKTILKKQGSFAIQYKL